MAKKTPRQRVIKRLDDVTSKIVRLKWPACVQCGSIENLTNGHVFSRRHYATRWDINTLGNCHTQCWGCNYKHSYDNYEYYKWFQNAYGEEAFEKLRDRYTVKFKMSTVELEELYQAYKEHYKKLESGGLY